MPAFQLPCYLCHPWFIPPSRLNAPEEAADARIVHIFVACQESRIVDQLVSANPEQWKNQDLRTDWVGTDELINDPRFLASYEYVDDPRVGGLFRRIGP